MGPNPGIDDQQPAPEVFKRIHYSALVIQITVFPQEVVVQINSRPDALRQMNAKALKRIHDIEESGPQGLKLLCISESLAHNWLVKICLEDSNGDLPRHLLLLG